VTLFASRWPMLAGALLVLAACGTKEPVSQEQLMSIVPPADELASRVVEPAELPVPTGEPLPPGTRIVFACENGERVTVAWFQPDGRAIMARGDQTLTMQQEEAIIGFRFASGPTSVEGSVDRFTLRDGQTETICIADREASAPAVAGGAAEPAAEPPVDVTGASPAG
jgi:predicted small lipoprotein YifL